MMCDVHASGTIEVYFYGELPPDERADVQAHLRQCAECRQALDDLTLIRAALASRPDVATPPAGDWSGFMTRLDAEIARVSGESATASPVLTSARWTRAVPLLAAAAVLLLVTISVLLVVRSRNQTTPEPDLADVGRPSPPAVAQASSSPDVALASLSDLHFERSKVVVLGLATKDAQRIDDQGWAYERERASSLLGDTRLYRRAAEAHGMNTLAGVMRDLEMVLLQTSMSEEPDAEALEQIQRLIRRRDLLTKMNVSYNSGP